MSNGLWNSLKLKVVLFFRSFFGGFGGFRFNFGGDGGGGHREIPRGGTIHMDMEVSLEDLYIGRFIEVCFSSCYDVMHRDTPEHLSITTLTHTYAHTHTYAQHTHTHTQFARYKPVAKPATGTRQCNCRTDMKTTQVGPGRFTVSLMGCSLTTCTMYM